MNCRSLPDVADLDEYRRIYHRDDLWRPAVEHVCSQHGLSGEECVRGPDGTHIVYFVGEAHVVKLFVSLFADDFTAERLAGAHLEGRLGVATPAIVAEGEVSRWPYLVLTRVPGRPVGEVWAGMGAAGRRRIATQIGEMISRLRSVPVDGLEPLTVDWQTFLSEQVESAPSRHGGSGFAWDLPGQMREYLVSAVETLAGDTDAVLVLADITDEHVMVSESDGNWNMVSYVDFGDAMIGHPDYEIVAPGVDIAKGDADVLRALLVAAGYPESELDDCLRRRLMMYTLLHRYVKLGEVLPPIPQASGAGDLEELSRIMWPF